MKILSAAIRSVLLTSPLLLAACGGGGSTTKSNPPPPVEPTAPIPAPVAPPVTPPVEPTPPAPGAVTPVEPTPVAPVAPTPIAPLMPLNAVLPTVYTPIAYTVPNAGTPDVSPYVIAYNHLDRTNVMEARAKGLTGSGVKVGLVDSDVNVFSPVLQGSIAAVNNVISGNTAKTVAGGGRTHGTYTSQMIAGQGLGNFQGGVAPGSTIYAAGAETLNYKDEYSLPTTAVTAATEWLTTTGVSIINNSWSDKGYFSTVKGREQRFAKHLETYAIAAQKAVNQNILIVFSTGNDSTPHPGSFGLLPLAYTDLEKGWLTVGAIDKDSLNLSDYSNACGDAMNWCLVAPGNVYVKDAALDISRNTEADFGRDRNISGTSFSAPIVSGVAALVKEQFPWMTNDQLRHTLLGTATDLGDPGVDAVFGYGLVNAGKAVNGLEWLNWGQETLSVTGVSEFSNNMFGAGGIEKSGAGELQLSGSNTYTGTTIVNAGVLNVSGSLASETFVKNGALLLSGRINNTLHNDALFTSLGGSLANFAQGKDGVWQAVLGAPTTIDGTATLDGQLVVAGRVNNEYVVKSVENIATATEFTGAFSSTAFAPSVLLDGAINVGVNSIDVNITRVDPTSLAVFQTSSVSQEMGVQLENAFSVADTLVNTDLTDEQKDFMGALGTTQSIQDANALYNWTAETSVQPTIASFNTLALIRHSETALVWDRLKSVRNDQSGVYATFGSDDFTHRPDGWLRSKLSGSNTTAGADWSNGSSVIGINGRYSDGNLSVGSTRSTVRSTTVGLYAAHNWSDWTAAVQVAQGEGNWRNRGAQADKIDQRSVSARVERGFATAYGRVTPGVSYTASRHTFDARNNYGATGMEMGFVSPTLKLNSWAADVGFESTTRATNSGWSWNWTAALGWEAIEQNGGEWSTYYQVDPSMVFTNSYARLDDNQWKGSLGVNTHKDRYSVFARWDGRTGSSLNSNSWQIGARVDF